MTWVMNSEKALPNLCGTGWAHKETRQDLFPGGLHTHSWYPDAPSQVSYYISYSRVSPWGLTKSQHGDLKEQALLTWWLAATKLETGSARPIKNHARNGTGQLLPRYIVQSGDRSWTDSRGWREVPTLDGGVTKSNYRKICKITCFCRVPGNYNLPHI